MRWIAGICGVALTASVLAGCTSMEDRIENAVEHEVQQCQQSNERWYTVGTQGESEPEVLAELCHLEMSEVEMHDDWTGTIRTGPIRWTASEDRDKRSVFMTGAAWHALDNALNSAGSDNVESLQEADEHFAEAIDEYGDSAWVRHQRLENLLDLRAEQRSSTDEELLGDQVSSYFEELIDWAENNDDPATQARARIAVGEHLQNYIAQQERSIEQLGSGDRRRERQIEHAEDDDDTERVEMLREELEQERAERPERRRAFGQRIQTAHHDGCEITRPLNVDGIDDGDLRSQITSAMGSFDCNYEVAEEDSDLDNQ